MADIWNRFGPTTARSHGRLGRISRPKSLTLDIHSHVMIPEAAAIAKPHLDLSTIPLAHFATPETKALNMQQDADRYTRITGYDERLKDMDEAGLDVQLVMPPPPQCYFTVPIEIAAKAITVGTHMPSPIVKGPAGASNFASSWPKITEKIGGKPCPPCSFAHVTPAKPASALAFW